MSTSLPRAPGICSCLRFPLEGKLSSKFDGIGGYRESVSNDLHLHWQASGRLVCGTVQRIGMCNPQRYFCFCFRVGSIRLHDLTGYHDADVLPYFCYSPFFCLWV